MAYGESVTVLNSGVMREISNTLDQILKELKTLNSKEKIDNRTVAEIISDVYRAENIIEYKDGLVKFKDSKTGDIYEKGIVELGMIPGAKREVEKYETKLRNSIITFCIHQKPIEGGILLADSIGKTKDQCFHCDEEEFKR